MNEPPPLGVHSLLQICVLKLASTLIKYGPKKVRFARLADLPRRALEALLQTLVARNALNDNVLLHVLTRETQHLGLEGATQLRRSVLNTIGRSCPNLRVLDIRTCQQVDNRIVRDVLQSCEHLEALRLDGCVRISDSAFAPALWKPPLAGLLGLAELSVAKCTQLTAEGLMGYVMKGAPSLRKLNLGNCRFDKFDEVASELVLSFGLESLDLSYCSNITDAAFSMASSSRMCRLKELHVASTSVSDSAVESVAAMAAPQLEAFDAGWVMKLTDRGVTALVQSCSRLRSLCICNTQVTDASFEAIVRCRHLERLDASWCLRATTRAFSIIASAETRPPLRELILDHLGALNLEFGQGELMALLPPPAVPMSPGLHPWSAPAPTAHMLQRGTTWPGQSGQVAPQRLPPEPFALLLPPSATEEAPQSSCEAGLNGDFIMSGLSPQLLQATACYKSPPLPVVEPAAVQPADACAVASLQKLVLLYGAKLGVLRLEGVRDVCDASVLEAIASACPVLRQLAVTLPASSSKDSDAAFEAALKSIGGNCRQLWTLRLDSSARPHRPAVNALKLPSFARLRSLTLWACAKANGLQDSELETVLGGRTSLQTLALRNCEGISEGLFPRWCHRGERHDEALVVEQLDKALLSSLNFGGVGLELGPEPVPGGGAAAASTSSPLMPMLSPTTSTPPAARRRSRKHPLCAAAQALRTVTSFSLGGATGLSDRSADALAELLHDAQVVDLRGCPLLSEEALRFFRKGCRFLRSGCIVTRDRTLSWTASTSGSVSKQHPRKYSFYTSGSSGTESS
eukprot:TRINITY_DN121755_c0_g1_i1.p1 TRINITY_DN121755_c0_g1~~TRINITY_DN121755_c0_g1_i1.p1  ORF type:complete len:801 (+),score=186.20 TRINITY_DN121755_c0_g1_i1:158-2560(+)